MTGRLTKKWLQTMRRTSGFSEITEFEDGVRFKTYRLSDDDIRLIENHGLRLERHSTEGEHTVADFIKETLPKTYYMPNSTMVVRP